MHTRLTHFAALRRHQRVPARIPVRIKVGDLSIDTVTADVSHSGAFVLVRMPEVPLCEELTMRFWLPDTLEYVVLRGRVMRHGYEVGRVGMGVEFTDVLTLWGRFVERLARHAPTTQRASRVLEEIELTWEGLSLDALDELLHVDVFIGGIFVKTDVEFEERARVRLVLVHPTNGAQLRISTRVTGRRERGERGVCVEFCEQAHVLSARVREFVEQGIPALVFNPVLIQRATQELLCVS